MTSMIPQEQKSRETATEEEAITDARAAAQALLEVGERVAYAVIAFIITLWGYQLAGSILSFHAELEMAAEVGMLNAGIAYYTHEVTGRIIRAMVVIARVPVEKITSNNRIVLKGRKTPDEIEPEVEKA